MPIEKIKYVILNCLTIIILLKERNLALPRFLTKTQDTYYGKTK